MMIVWRLRGNMLCVLFYLGQLSHFLSCFGTGVTNLNEPSSSFLLPPHYCGLGAGSIPFRAIANNKQCEMRGLFMSLVIHYWIGDVQDCQGVSASEMTCIVSSGALNSTHSLLVDPGFLSPLNLFKHRGSLPRKMDAPDRHNGQRDACLLVSPSVRPFVRSSVWWSLTVFSRHFGNVCVLAARRWTCSESRSSLC